MKRPGTIRPGLVLAVLLFTVADGFALEYTEKRQPCLSREPLRQPFFGDLHVHTRYSLDASTQGTRTTPTEAYRFARGGVLGIQPWSESGEPLRSMQLPRPLDFAVVADHAELFGEVHMCNTPGFEGYDSWQCMIYRNWSLGAYYLFNYMSSMRAAHLGMCGEGDRLCHRAAAIPWNDVQRAAEVHYDRSDTCAFTTFVGYEWTGMDPETGGNLHRNIIFRNANVPSLPITFIDEPSAERLWRTLDERCEGKGDGCEALAIPHNSNLSAGVMFTDGLTMDADYARLRQRREPLLEMMQKGGASECYFKAGISQDELCGFEQQPIDNLAGFNNPPGPETGFARKILLQGMAIEDALGINPYRLGFVGSTDTHLGAAGAVAEWDYVGHGGKGVPATDSIPPGLPDLLDNNPGGLAVLWAEENSRDALFEALRRREVYATSGTRILSRLFGAWRFPETLCALPDRIERAYENGVPMGGELSLPVDGSPTFLVVAGRDPGTEERPGTLLQRVQIVKGWITASGELREKVFDVAGDGHRGETVDTAACAPPQEGASELCTVWTDPEFSANERAYYYSRTLEMPTCRWSQRICAKRGVDCARPETIGEGLRACCDAGHRKVIQERAWSSPIWYRPEPETAKTGG